MEIENEEVAINMIKVDKITNGIKIHITNPKGIIEYNVQTKKLKTKNGVDISLTNNIIFRIWLLASARFSDFITDFTDNTIFVTEITKNSRPVISKLIPPKKYSEAPKRYNVIMNNTLKNHLNLLPPKSKFFECFNIPLSGISYSIKDYTSFLNIC